MFSIIKSKTFLFLLLILAIASFFRLWQLDYIPPGLYPDVAMNGNDALNSLKTGNFKVFYPENNGREGLMMWLIALSFSIFGTSIWSIKIVAALVGIFTVLGLYLLTKELFNNVTMKQLNNEAVALLASFFLAISFWHVNFSRIGFRAILLPLVLVFSFYFLFKGFRERKITDFIISGILFGLGFYTYISFRIIAILFFILIFWWFLYNLKVKKGISFFAKSTFCFLSLSFLVALPMGIYFLNHPEHFISRAAGVSVFTQTNPLLAFSESSWKHFLMFNVQGDPNWRHNYADSPMLPLPLGILFLMGFLIVSFRGYLYSKRTDDFSLILSRNYGFLILWFIFALLPGLLTYEGIPHSLRTLGVVPVVYIFAGIGGSWIYEKLKLIIKERKIFPIVCVLFLFIIGYSEFNKYFFGWAKRQAVAEAFTQKYADIGQFLNSLPNDVQKYVILNEPGSPLYGISIPGQAPMFIESAKFGKPRATYLTFENLDQIKVGQKKTVIIPLYDGRVFDELSKRFPQNQIKETETFQYYEINQYVKSHY